MPAAGAAESGRVPMPEIDQFLTSSWALWAALVVAGAGWIHGVMGMGFPLITIALIAMTAVLVTVLPNIAVNLYSIARGGNWSHSLGSHWRIAVYVPLGAVVGTEMLLLIPPEPLKLLLACTILLYLNMARLKRLSFSGLRAYPRMSEAGFGLLAGILSGTVSVSIPPLAIYFMGLGLAPTAMVQIMNLCFLFGKATQAATLGFAGEITRTLVLASVPLSVVALGFLALGARLRSRTRTEVYYGWLHKTLLLMAAILLLQVARAWSG